ncbi:MAG TPA: tetratricopeptide repeat protein, partial [Flavobacteriales bacterium]|nr:tetratricopeptide repeat protein [Flavobacteriales bacterium]
MLTWFIVLTNVLCAQTNNDRDGDSLIACLNKARVDSLRVDVLNKLFLHYEYSDVQKSKKYLQQAMALADQSGYTNGKAEAYTNLGYSLEDAGNNREALKNYYHALKLYQKSGNRKGQANCYNNIGFSYASFHDNAKAIKYMRLSLKMKKALKDHAGVASAYNNLGLVYAQLGNYPEALKN